MVKKKGKKTVKKRISKITKSESGAWFRKRRGLFSPDLGYGWVPITWQGYVMVFLLLAVNAFSVFNFGVVSGEANSILKFLTVLVLSILVFTVIAIKKSRGSNYDP